MSERQSRRQWLLGLVGAVFGVGAARAVERYLPGGKPEKNVATQLWLTCTYRDENGVYNTSSESLSGSVTVALDPQTGNVLVEVRDPKGRPIRQTCYPNVSVQVHRGPTHPPSTGGLSYSTFLGGSGSYDAAGPSTYWHGGTITYSYDGNGDLLPEQS
jgi:hypothetical protein